MRSTHLPIPTSPKLSLMPSNSSKKLLTNSSSSSRREILSKTPIKSRRSEEDEALDLIVEEENRDEIRQYLKNLIEDLNRFKAENRKLKQELDLHNQI